MFGTEVSVKDVIVHITTWLNLLELTIRIFHFSWIFDEWSFTAIRIVCNRDFIIHDGVFLFYNNTTQTEVLNQNVYLIVHLKYWKNVFHFIFQK